MKLDPKRSKSDFPAYVGAFLDTAATSKTPKRVLGAMNEYYEKYRASVHRGLYLAAESATAKYEEARSVVARFVGAETDEIVFTSGATESSNMLARMIEPEFKKGDRIVTTIMEHHSSLVPLQQLAKRKSLKLDVIPLKGTRLDMKALERSIASGAKIVSVSLASNVTGRLNDVAKIAKLARKAGAFMVTDATAAAGHTPIDVVRLGVDFLYFSGHKMCGPTGIGVLFGRKALLERLQPADFGGGMVDEVTNGSATWTSGPQKHEAGTPNVAGAIGLAEAVRYIESVGIEDIRAHVQALTGYAVEKLSAVRGIEFFCERDPAQNVGIVSFVMKGIHPHDIAQIAAGMNVAIRAGHHCAEPLMREFGIPAAARASFYLYNAKKDIDDLAKALDRAERIFGRGAALRMKA